MQNRGVGSKLLRRLVIAARNRLIQRIHMVCLMDNGEAVRMARRLGGVLYFHDGEAQAQIESPWPTPWTWLEELFVRPRRTHSTIRPLPPGRGGSAPTPTAWPLIEPRARCLFR